MVAYMERQSVPSNKRMKQTSLSAAPGQMEAPPRAPQGQVEGRTGSQLIRGVGRTRVARAGPRDDGYFDARRVLLRVEEVDP
jgi:hypothetical protein